MKASFFEHKARYCHVSFTSSHGSGLRDSLWFCFEGGDVKEEDDYFRFSYSGKDVSAKTMYKLWILAGKPEWI